MWSNLVVLHTEDKSQSVGELPGYFAWQTCMRSVYVGDARLNGKNPYDFKGRFEIYTGYAAYRALLEIISGMRSRLFGETEVLAQFKERFKATNLPDTAFRAYLIQLHDQLVADCKYIRTHYLTHRGEQSYGGLAHRRLKGVRSVSLLGTGQLAEKVIPWLQKENRNVRVVGRNPERLEHLRERFGVETANLHSFDPRQDALVIAAPVAVQPVMPRIADQAIIIDFREDPLSDEFPERVDYHSFASILATLEETRQRNDRVRQQLNPVLDGLVQEREMTHQEFVHGWEDLPCLAS